MPGDAPFREAGGGEAGLAPVTGRATVGDRVFTQLRDALILGRFDPGQILTIAALAETFHTSHMPVREAIRRLVAEGALEIRRGGSAHVPPTGRHRLDDICRARIALERMATELAAERIDAAGLDRLARLEEGHAATTASGDVARMLRQNRDFHFAIYRAADADVLLNLITSLWLRYGPFMRLLSNHMAPTVHRDAHARFVRGHHAIVEAIRAGDPAVAGARMADDIAGTQTLLRDLCED